METDKKWALIVDDDQNSRQILRKYLSFRGFEIIMAKDGEEALEILARGPVVDLIITDIMMPYLSGFDLTVKLKEHAATRDIPVIGMSAFSDWSDARKGNELIVDEFIVKPIDRDALNAAITRVMVG